jgi:hypothetical protein
MISVVIRLVAYSFSVDKLPARYLLLSFAITSGEANFKRVRDARRHSWLGAITSQVLGALESPFS